MFLDTFLGKVISTFFISMMPIVELRGGIPFGVACGLSVAEACTAAITGNLLPIPFVILFIRKIFDWLRSKSEWLNVRVSKFEEHTLNKADRVRRYSFWGLFIFVAIPLPGTGAWTGALIAALLGIRLKTALPAITLGVFSAAFIMTCLTYGVGALFFF